MENSLPEKVKFYTRVLDFLTRSVSYEGDKALVSARMNARSFAFEVGFRFDFALFFSFEAMLSVGPFSVSLLYDKT